MKDRKTVEREILNPPTRRVGGTVGDDVMTVHRLTEGRPVCGASGNVDEWQRRVTCPVCLSSSYSPVTPTR